MNSVVGCCDIGGSTLRVALADRNGNLLIKQSVPHARPSPEATMEQIARTLEELAQSAEAQMLGVGASAPGPLDHATGVIAFSPNLGWREVRFVEQLATRLHVPVALDDDANCAALGEQWCGIASGVRDFLYVIVGTGIGAGLILDGKIYRGAQGFAGELGHTTIIEDGPGCSCGNRGCLEALAAGPALVRLAKQVLAEGRASCLAPNDLNAREVMAAARAGDALAREIIQDAGRFLGIGLANVVNLLNPAIIAVGGGVALDAGELLLVPARRELKLRALSHAANAVQLVLATLGDDAGLVGAARLIWETLQRQASA